MQNGPPAAAPHNFSVCRQPGHRQPRHQIVVRCNCPGAQRPSVNKPIWRACEQQVWGLGFGVWGLGFGVWGLGVWGLGSSFCKPNPHTAAASSPASAPSACAAASGFILPRIFCSPCSGATQPELTSSVLDFPYVRSRHAGATTCNPSHASHNPQLTDDTQAAAALLAGSRDTR